MLDFDHICGRSKPSVAAMVYPFAGNHMQKFYWGAQEIVISVFEKLSEACAKHPDVQILVSCYCFGLSALVEKLGELFGADERVCLLCCANCGTRSTSRRAAPSTRPSTKLSNFRSSRQLPLLPKVFRNAALVCRSPRPVVRVSPSLAR